MEVRQRLSTPNVADDRRSVSTYKSRMEAMRGRLAISSVVGDASSVRTIDDQGRIEESRMVKYRWMTERIFIIWRLYWWMRLTWIIGQLMVLEKFVKSIDGAKNYNN